SHWARDAPNRMWRAFTANTTRSSGTTATGLDQNSRAANCEAPANTLALMAVASGQPMPFSAAAAPKARPNGTTEAATGQRPRNPRRAPATVRVVMLYLVSNRIKG